MFYVPLLLLCLAAPVQANKAPTDAERAAAMIVHWQQIVYPQLEDARAYIDEDNSDHVNALLSQGAVRAVHDRVEGGALDKLDQSVRQLTSAMIKAAPRQPGGSIIIDAEAVEKGLDAVCPLYPFCQR